MLRWILTSSLLICTHILLNAQYCIEGRFTQNAYFDSSEVITQKDLSYGLADNWFLGIQFDELNYLDIAYPDMAIDPLEKRPLVVLAHGGGFWGGEKNEMDTMVQNLAMRGFVVVSANYRKGWMNNGDAYGCSGDGESLDEAIYKSMQDLRACLRYLVYHADEWKIDTANIFVGGESAGAYAMINAINISQEEWNTLHPDDYGIYGSLDGSTNDINVNFSVKGFINMWGGVSDTALIQKSEMRPTISFYGMSDDIVPPYSGYFQGCENYAYLYGSESINAMLQRNTICSAIHARPGFGHIAYRQEYVADNAACFIKSILCNQCTSYDVNYQLGSCSDLAENGTTAVLPSDNAGWTIYPNPVRDFAVIHINATDAITDWKLISATGQIVAVTSTINGSSITLQTESLPAGLYYFSASSNGRLHNISFVVQ